MRVGHKVLIKADDGISLIGGDPRGILDQQLRPHPIHILNIITILINFIKLYILRQLNAVKSCHLGSFYAYSGISMYTDHRDCSANFCAVCDPKWVLSMCTQCMADGRGTVA